MMRHSSNRKWATPTAVATLWRRFAALFLVVVMMTSTTGTAMASEYRGQVTLGNVLVPGVAVTATRGDKTVTAITDDQGMYTFPDLADGEWTIEIGMSGFAKQKQVVTIGSSTPPAAWDLKMLPMSEIGAVSAAV